jgi:hypothetical protein
MRTEIEINEFINKRTIEFVFSQRQYDEQFIEVAQSLGLSEYFTNLDLDNCDLEDCMKKVRMVTKNIGELDFILTLTYNNFVRLLLFIKE